jgi:polysaccharide chain length determinant protein (PEP-CTERM system associated)
MLGARQLTLEDYVAILRRRKREIILSILAAPLLAYVLALILPKEYTSQTVILIDQPHVSESYVTSIDSSDLRQRLASVQEELLSSSRLGPVIRALGLYQAEQNTVPAEVLANRLRKKITISPVKPMPQTNSPDLPGFTVKASAGSPQLAQKICAAVTNMFLQSNLHLREARAEDTTAFLTKELQDAKKNLDAEDAKLAAFKTRYIGELPDDQQANLNILAGLNSQLDAVTQSLGRAEQDKAFAESMLSQQIAAWKASQVGQNPETLEKQLTDLQAQLAEAQVKYTDDHPDVIKLKANIADLKKQIAATSAASASPAGKDEMRASIETPEIGQLRAQVHQYEASVKEKAAQQKEIQRQVKLYQSRLQLSPSVEEQYKVLTRDHASAADFYNDLLKKRSESAMAANLRQSPDTDRFRILDPPDLPSSPSFPIRLYFVLGGLAAGIATGLGVALVREALDRTLRTERDIDAFLQVPTLVLIPSVGALGNGRTHKKEPALTDTQAVGRS